MYETKPYFYGTGRRKHSVARVRVYNGTGKVTINGRDINDLTSGIIQTFCSSGNRTNTSDRLLNTLVDIRKAFLCLLHLIALNSHDLLYSLHSIHGMRRVLYQNICNIINLFG